MKHKTYRVKYKAPGMLFWRRVWFAVEDGLQTPVIGPHKKVGEPRFCVRSRNGAELNLPFNGTLLRFSKSREAVKIESGIKEDS